MAWELIVDRRRWATWTCVGVGILYLLVLYTLADWRGVAIAVVVIATALIAVRQDPDVPFFPSGLGLVIWLALSLTAFLPALIGTPWFPTYLKSFSAGILLSAQSGMEYALGSQIWERLWSIPHRAPHLVLEGAESWWLDYFYAQLKTLRWLSAILAIALLATLFLISTPYRRPRDRFHPVLWRSLMAIGWLVAGSLTNMWLVCPIIVAAHRRHSGPKRRNAGKD